MLERFGIVYGNYPDSKDGTWSERVSTILERGNRAERRVSASGPG